MKRAALALLAVLLFFAGGALAWLVASEPGLRWVLARAEAASGGRLQIEGAHGTLATTISIAHATFADAGTEIEARQVQVQADALALLRGQIGFEPLRVESLRLALSTAGAPAAAQPGALLPFGVRIARLEIARFELVAGEQRQQLTELRFAHAVLSGHTLSASGSFTRPDARFPAHVRLEVGGTLERVQAALAGKVAGVSASADLTLVPSASPALRSLEARAGPIDLSHLDASLPQTTLSADLKATARKIGYEGTLSLANAAPGPLDAGRLPVIAARSRFASPDLASAVLDGLRIELAGGGMLQGKAGLDARRLQAALEARAIDLQALRSDLRRTALQGALEVVVAAAEQSVRGSLTQEGMGLEAHVVRHGNVLDVRALRAAAAGGEASGTGRIELGEPLAAQAQLRFERFDPAAFGDYPHGSFNGRLGLDGRLGGNSFVDTRWTLERSTLLGRPLAGSGSARISRARISGARVEATYGASVLSLRGSFGRAGDRLDWTLAIPRLQEIDPGISGALQAEGVLAGAWDTHELTLLARSPTARVEAHLVGGLQPGGDWQGEVRSLTNTGDYPLRMTASTPLRVGRGRVELGLLDAELASGRLSVREAQWAGGRLATRGDFSALPARWLVLAAGATAKTRTTLLLDGSWALAASPRLEGSLQLRRRDGDIAIAFDEEPFALGLEAAVLDVRFTDGGAAVTLDVASSYGKLALAGEVRPAPGAVGIMPLGTDSPLDLRARLDAAALSVVAQPVITQARVDGRLWAELQVSGTLGSPRLAGKLRGEGLKLEMPPYGVYLRNGTFVAELGEDNLRLTQFSIRAGTGEFTASGEVPLRLDAGGAKLAWSARNLSVLERPDLRLAVSGEGNAAFDGKRLSLKGELRAERGTLRIDQDRLPQPGDDVIIAGRAPKAARKATPLPLDLDIQLDLGQNLRLESYDFEGKLTGRVRCVAGDDGALRAYGRVRMVNALVFAFGQRLEVDPGELIFDGPIDNPALSVVAWRRNLAVEAGVLVSGNLQTPRVQLVSNPPVPEAERLSWLVLGRAPGEASRADLGLLQAAAGTLLSSGENLPLDRRVARAVGLDEVTLRGAGEAEGNVVAFGKRISDRLYVSYEQGLGVAATNLVKLDYVLGRRWSLRAESGTTNGAGLFYRFSWD